VGSLSPSDKDAYLLISDINQNNILAMMVSIERRLDTHSLNQPEHKFYSHTLQYLTSTSGQQARLEDWMISTFDVDFGVEIGAGGLWVAGYSPIPRLILIQWVRIQRHLESNGGGDQTSAQFSRHSRKCHGANANP
jgi:hypothetical protein